MDGLCKGSRLVLAALQLIQTRENFIVNGNQSVRFRLQCGRRQSKVSHKLNMTAFSDWRMCRAVSATICP